MTVYTSARRVTLVLLGVLVILSIARQTFDVIGRQWMPMVVNFLFLLFAAFGAVGAWRQRPAHVLVNAAFLPFYMVWNVFLACFYLNVAPLDRSTALLAFGGRLSSSFWLQYMPWCRGAFDFTAQRWAMPADEKDCFVPYFYVEVVQAAVHFTLAFFTFFAMLVLVCTLPKMRHLKAPRRAPPQPNDYAAATPEHRNNVTRNASQFRAQNGTINHQNMTQYSDADVTITSPSANLDMTNNTNTSVNYTRRTSKKKTRRQLDAEDAYRQAQQRNHAAIMHILDSNSQPFDVPHALPQLLPLSRSLHSSRQTSLVDLTAPSPRAALQPSSSLTNLHNHHFNNSHRLSVVEPRSSTLRLGCGESDDSLLAEKNTNTRGRKYSTSSTRRLGGAAEPPTTPTSLISFDPKSSTLIRCQPHVAEHHQHQHHEMMPPATPSRQTAAARPTPPSSADSGVHSGSGADSYRFYREQTTATPVVSRRPMPPSENTAIGHRPIYATGASRQPIPPPPPPPYFTGLTAQLRADKTNNNNVITHEHSLLV